MRQGALRWHVYGVVLIATLTVLMEVLVRPEIVVESCSVPGGVNHQTP
ncbi:hypothetical protein RDI58_021079 [Solanum bulbocastanum]|uniref:Uncharacterized protein n=1 Tax=Solanum bulbocastanum TaxID=147425 RepID=A0AAN8Y8G2_SOLBU